MSGTFIMLDQDDWEEIPKRHMQTSGNVYVGKDHVRAEEVKVFVRKNKMNL
jgi:hypothetical protein